MQANGDGVKTAQNITLLVTFPSHSVKHVAVFAPLANSSVRIEKSIGVQKTKIMRRLNNRNAAIFERPVDRRGNKREDVVDVDHIGTLTGYYSPNLVIGAP